MIASINNNSYGAQALEAVRQNRFKKIDQDGDGKITPDELKAGMPRKGNGPSVEDIFSKVDTNQDGAIDEAEDKAALDQLWKNRPPAGPPDPARIANHIFKKADADGDGKITSEELSAALPNGKKSPKADDLFNAADADGDGSISKSDLESAIQKMIEQRRASWAPPRNSGTERYDRTGGGTEPPPPASLLSTEA